MFTVDASVWLNADSPSEPNHADSRALMDRIAADSVSIIAPTLLLVEVAGAISRTRGEPVLALDYANSMRRLPLVRWIPLDDAMSTQAALLASSRALRGADAVYAAVALAHGCVLVSLDREHLTRLPPVLTTITPGEALARWRTPPRP